MLDEGLSRVEAVILHTRRSLVNLILLASNEVNASAGATLSGPRADHLLKVLKVAPGHRVRVGILDGPLGVGTVESVTPETVDLRCALEATIPPRPNIDLLLAVPRPKVMRRLWAQIAALGVGQIVLTNAERVERNYFRRARADAECYVPLLIEDCSRLATRANQRFPSTSDSKCWSKTT